MFGAAAHRDDVIRGAEEDRESAKGRKREIRKDEAAASQETRASDACFFRVFAINSVMSGVRGRDIAATVSDFHSVPKLELGNQDGKGEPGR